MAIQNGPNLNSVPSPGKQATAGNYLDFTSGTNDWAQQYLPDLMAQEAEVFGPRTISGFLAQVGAEEGMTSDQVVWSEQSRLHLSYKGKVQGADTVRIQCDIDENTFAAGGISTASPAGRHGVRVNDTVIIAGANNGANKCLVTAVSGDDITVKPYTTANIDTGDSADKSVTILVYGSEYKKGTEWAAANLNQSEISSFDKVVSTGDPNVIELAVAGLKAKYDNSNGYEGRMLTGKSTSSTDVFRSQAQLVQAMADPRYDNDPALSLIHI